ncbi:hypothetical protein PILCRDRAFT_828616 [Piloderma croceum F 1598]|uniref:Uncharacterized protein n=1 Tax=Piloderma croceum (strain F 1598) TaxID=765440 RepID=A0A0C3F1L6_PILCF|nr:hypothetical protein PILCRDRAFT_828616 [Piloderma croceum F 1598]
MGCLFMPPPPLCANDANENEVPRSLAKDGPCPPMESVGGYEGILFGEAADDTGGNFEVGGRLVVFFGNIDSEFLLRTYNGIVRFEFIRLASETFSTEPVTVDESTMGGLCVFE